MGHAGQEVRGLAPRGLLIAQNDGYGRDIGSGCACACASGLRFAPRTFLSEAGTRNCAYLQPRSSDLNLNSGPGIRAFSDGFVRTAACDAIIPHLRIPGIYLAYPVRYVFFCSVLVKKPCSYHESFFLKNVLVGPRPSCVAGTESSALKPWRTTTAATGSSSCDVRREGTQQNDTGGGA